MGAKFIHRIYALLLLSSLVCIGCEWQFKMMDDKTSKIQVARYDRIQSQYLTTGDFSALQQMNTAYPQQTRTLIEDVLQIGKVDDQQIYKKFLHFYQDSTLQTIISDIQQQYASIDDINEQLTHAFDYLRLHLSVQEYPEVYAQIGALDQSVIVGNGAIGICLDKYLGAAYPLYHKPEYGYSDAQISMMSREYIVPDCVGFYLLSLYPMPASHRLTQHERDMHIGKIQWVVNQAMGYQVFHSDYVTRVAHYMQRNKNATIDQMLNNNEYTDFAN